MKLASIILLFGIFAVSPIAVYADAGEMTKKEAESFLRDLVKEKIEEGASKVAPDTMKAIDGVKKTIADYGVKEEDFLATLDEMSRNAFDDQCTGSNPRYPLISEIKEMYRKAYYGKDYQAKAEAVKEEKTEA